MVFSSMIFLCIFLPVTFGLHLLLPGMRAKNMLLVIASLLFYAYGEPVYVLLLIGSSFFNYLFAWLVERDPGHKKVWVVAAVLANLAVLIIFKYTGFLISSFNSITGAAVPVPHGSRTRRRRRRNAWLMMPCFDIHQRKEQELLV